MLKEVRGRKGQLSSHPRGPLLDAGEAAPPDASVQGRYVGTARAKALITHGVERTGQRKGREGGMRGDKKERGGTVQLEVKGGERALRASASEEVIKEAEMNRPSWQGAFRLRS